MCFEVLDFEVPEYKCNKLNYNKQVSFNVTKVTKADFQYDYTTDLVIEYDTNFKGLGGNTISTYSGTCGHDAGDVVGFIYLMPEAILGV